MSVLPSANVVIVEGTCGSGKTTLLKAASSMSVGREVSVLFQRTTYAPIAPMEDDGTLDDISNRRALLDILQQVRTEVTSRRLVFLDTLHATHFVRGGVLSLGSFKEIDQALHSLAAFVVVLEVDEEAIRTRAIVGRRDTGFYEYAKKFGANEDDRRRYFAGEQRRVIDLLATHSALPQIIIDGNQAPESVYERFQHIVRQRC